MDIQSDSPNKLLLFFDINKTVLISDTAKGLSLRDCIKELISQYAWGVVNNNDQWELKHSELVFEQPNEGLISYYTYLEKKYKLLSIQDEPDEQKRVVINSEIKTKVRLLRRSLVNEDTQYKDLLEKFKKLESAVKLADIGISKENLPVYCESGDINLVYSFFHLMLLLQKDNRDFTICFRTFGQDIKEVSNEFNDFCKGIHPFFNGQNGMPLAKFDGKNGTKNYLIDMTNTGMLYRSSTNVDETDLILGSTERKQLNLFKDSDNDNSNIVIISGAKNIYSKLKERNSCYPG